MEVRTQNTRGRHKSIVGYKGIPPRNRGGLNISRQMNEQRDCSNKRYPGFGICLREKLLGLTTTLVFRYFFVFRTLPQQPFLLTSLYPFGDFSQNYQVDLYPTLGLRLCLSFYWYDLVTPVPPTRLTDPSSSRTYL